MGIGGSIIKNPLTIIAIFAGIVEIGSNSVLPFLTESNQSTYIWFLMIFPIMLVACFFYILYNKHEVLYAPSDFKNDETFQNVLFQRRKSTTNEVTKKREEEIIEIKKKSKKVSKKENIPSSNSISLDKTNDFITEFRENFLSNRRFFRYIEEYLLDRVKLKSDEFMEKEVTLEDNKGNKIISDAVIFSKNISLLNLVEVKIPSREMATRHMIQSYIKRNEKILSNLGASQNLKLTFIILTPDKKLEDTYTSIQNRMSERHNKNIEINPYIITDFNNEKIEYINMDSEKDIINYNKNIKVENNGS